MLMYLKMDECTLTLSVLSLHPVVHSSWDYSLALKSKHSPSCLGIPHYIHTDTQTHTHTHRCSVVQCSVVQCSVV